MNKEQKIEELREIIALWQVRVDELETQVEEKGATIKEQNHVIKYLRTYSGVWEEAQFEIVGREGIENIYKRTEELLENPEDPRPWMRRGDSIIAKEKRMSK